MCGVTRVSGGRVISEGQTSKKAGFSSGAYQNCLNAARSAPASREANDALGARLLRAEVRGGPQQSVDSRPHRRHKS